MRGLEADVRRPIDRAEGADDAHSAHQNTLTQLGRRPVAGGRGRIGPATLENYHFLEKISHFDRERIPERVHRLLADLDAVVLLRLRREERREEPHGVLRLLQADGRGLHPRFRAVRRNGRAI